MRIQALIIALGICTGLGFAYGLQQRHTLSLVWSLAGFVLALFILFLTRPRK